MKITRITLLFSLSITFLLNAEAPYVFPNNDPSPHAPKPISVLQGKNREYVPIAIKKLNQELVQKTKSKIPGSRLSLADVKVFEQGGAKGFIYKAIGGKQYTSFLGGQMLDALVTLDLHGDDYSIYCSYVDLSYFRYKDKNVTVTKVRNEKNVERKVCVDTWHYLARAHVRGCRPWDITTQKVTNESSLKIPGLEIAPLEDRAHSLEYNFDQDKDELDHPNERVFIYKDLYLGKQNIKWFCDK